MILITSPIYHIGLALDAPHATWHGTGSCVYVYDNVGGSGWARPGADIERAVLTSTICSYEMAALISWSLAFVIVVCLFIIQ